MNRKRMRNVFIQKIDNILMDYYKELNFEQMNSDGDFASLTDEYRREAMKIIDFMNELELLSDEEFVMLKEVYGECFL